MARREDRPAPFSIRLSPAERAVLRAQAGQVPLGTYLRGLVLGRSAGKRSARRSPSEGRSEVAQLLAQLGSSHIAESLSALASQAASGALLADAETAVRLRQACDEVSAMRAMLMQALGRAPGRFSSPAGVADVPSSRSPEVRR